MSIKIEKDTLYLVVYKRNHEHMGKEYKIKVYLTGFFDLDRRNIEDPYFIGTTYVKIKGMKNPYCDLTEVNKEEFDKYCKVIKKFETII